ncbi:MAG: hypothetical protein HY370_07005 [Proteobacteria bacterium]|nr:hypothetical protein [Pseudomonadota bacterium]
MATVDSFTQTEPLRQRPEAIGRERKPGIFLSPEETRAEEQRFRRYKQQEEELRKREIKRRSEEEERKEDKENADETVTHIAATFAELTDDDIVYANEFNFESPDHAAALNIEASQEYEAAFNEGWDGYYDATYRTIQIGQDGSQYYAYPTEDGKTSYIKIGADGKFFGFVPETEMDGLMREGLVKGVYTDKNGQMVYADGKPVEESAVKSINNIRDQFGIDKDATSKDAETAQNALAEFDKMHQLHEAAAAAEGRCDTIALDTDLSPQEKFLELQKARVELEMKRLDEKVIVDPQEKDEKTKESVVKYQDVLKKVEDNLKGKTPAEQEEILKKTFGSKYDDFAAKEQARSATAPSAAAHDRSTGSFAGTTDKPVAENPKETSKLDFSKASQGISDEPKMPEAPPPSLTVRQQTQATFAIPGGA